MIVVKWMILFYYNFNYIVLLWLYKFFALFKVFRKILIIINKEKKYLIKLEWINNNELIFIVYVWYGFIYFILEKNNNF